ncbi:MAG: response regulator, partial [Oceanobacter sp.]
MNHFLIVEDDPTTIKILGHLLKKVVADRFVVCSSFSETVKTLSDPAYQFIGALVDIELPDAPRGEAVDLILESDLPCVVLTANKEHSLREEMLGKGAADFITKDGRHWFYYAVEVLKRFEDNRRVTALVACGSDPVSERLCHMLHAFRFPILDARTAKETLKILKTRPDVQLLLVDME